MSWVTIIWSMVAAACLTLAVMHLLIWGRKRTAWASLLFAVTAVATAAMAGGELWMMRAETAREFGVALRWSHVLYWVWVISLVGFVRLYLPAGRPWLAWTVCVMRTVSLLPNFLVGENLNYRTITGLRLVFLTPNWEDFVHLTCTEIRHCGAGSVQIMRRMRSMLENLVQTLPPHRHAELRKQLELLDRTIEG